MTCLMVRLAWARNGFALSLFAFLVWSTCSAGHYGVERNIQVLLCGCLVRVVGVEDGCDSPTGTS